MFVFGWATGPSSSLHIKVCKIYYLQLSRKDVVKDVDFLLWTKHNPFAETILKYDDSLPESLSHSHFDENLPTKILVHGYDGYGTQEWVINVKDAYLMTGNKCINVQRYYK